MRAGGSARKSGLRSQPAQRASSRFLPGQVWLLQRRSQTYGTMYSPEPCVLVIVEGNSSQTDAVSDTLAVGLVAAPQSSTLQLSQSLSLDCSAAVGLLAAPQSSALQLSQSLSLDCSAVVGLLAAPQSSALQLSQSLSLDFSAAVGLLAAPQSSALQPSQSLSLDYSACFRRDFQIPCLVSLLLLPRLVDLQLLQHQGLWGRCCQAYKPQHLHTPSAPEQVDIASQALMDYDCQCIPQICAITHLGDFDWVSKSLLPEHVLDAAIPRSHHNQAPQYHEFPLRQSLTLQRIQLKSV